MPPTLPASTTSPGYDLLSFFDEEKHDDVLSLATARALEAEDVLISQGEAQPGLFIVTRGVLDVRVGSQKPISVGKRGAGELLGEVSFLTGEGANATVVAQETSEVLALPAEALRQQLQQHPRFASRFYQMIGRIVAGKLTELSRRAVPYTLAITHSEELDGKIRGTVHQLKADLFEIDTELGKQKGQVSGEMRSKTHELLDQAMEFLTTLFGPDSEVPKALQQDVAHFLRQELLPYILMSRICEQSYTKPRGYAGDFQAIDIIYSNEPAGVGRLGPLLDEYYLNIAVSQAVRNRRGLLLEVFMELFDERPQEQLHITSLACGPAREVFDLFERLDDPTKAIFNCLDLDFRALSSVSRVAEERGFERQIRLMQENLIMLALGRHKTSLPPQDLMYSIGLIDYFQDNLVIKLLNWIFPLLRPGGRVVLGNFDPCNPDRAFMDHLLEWSLIYRSPDDMRRLFASSDFADRPVDIRYEQRGINLFATCRA